MRKAELSEEYCSIARAGAQIGDAWTFLILRELFLSNRSFEGLRQQTGMSPASLSQRLVALEQAEVLLRKTPGDKPRKAQYILTQKGLELWPVVVAIKQWGDKWFGPWDGDTPPVSLEHKGCGHPLVVETVCGSCGQAVRAAESHPVISAAFAETRTRRELTGKAARRRERSA